MTRRGPIFERCRLRHVSIDWDTIEGPRCSCKPGRLTLVCRLRVHLEQIRDQSFVCRRADANEQFRKYSSISLDRRDIFDNQNLDVRVGPIRISGRRTLLPIRTWCVAERRLCTGGLLPHASIDRAGGHISIRNSVILEK